MQSVFNGGASTLECDSCSVTAVSLPVMAAAGCEHEELLESVVYHDYSYYIDIIITALCVMLVVAHSSNMLYFVTFSHARAILF